MDDSILEAIWCVDSETGERRLLDLKTGEDITPTCPHNSTWFDRTITSNAEGTDEGMHDICNDCGKVVR